MKGLNVVSLFTGAGGLDYGFEAAGYRICVAVETDPDCCATLRANRQWPVMERDINETTSEEILDTAILSNGEVDLIIGGAPCQPFSKSAYWKTGDTKRLSDPRADTLTQFMRCVADILPKSFVLENVHGICYSGKEEGLQLLKQLTAEINRTDRTNYQLSWHVLNAADYGVPQIRKRFFLVGHRDGKIFDFPSPTHIPQNGTKNTQTTSGSKKKPPYRTAWDAIGGLNGHSNEDLTLRGKWADLLPSIPEGENYLWHTNRGGGLQLFGWRTRYWSCLLKLAKKRPSWTIQAHPSPATGPFHWENRRLSTEEMAKLQTLPKDMVFTGNRGSIQKQIGNAVPSLLSEVIARAIAKQFFGLSISGRLKFSVKQKTPIPPPAPIEDVPKKYLELVGNHYDHPSTRKSKLYNRSS